MPGFNLQDYEPVEDRIRAFWTEHPEGRITTDMVHVGPDGYIVKALVWREPRGNYVTDIGEVVERFGPDATGYAQEAVTERGVNSTSALENCETSAIGRALANLGYAAKGKRPSREEMNKATPGQATAPEASVMQGEGVTGAAVESNPTLPGRNDSTATSGGATSPVATERSASGLSASPDDSGADSTPDASAQTSPSAAGSEAGEKDVTPSHGTASDPISVALPMDEPDAKATDEQWERLLATVGGSMQKAVNRLNVVNHTAYTKATAQDGATRAEVANAITGAAA